MVTSWYFVAITCKLQVLVTMVTCELLAYVSDIDKFQANASWAICSTYHTVLKASPGAVIFWCNMLFNIPYIADWNKIGDRSICVSSSLKVEDTIN